MKNFVKKLMLVMSVVILTLPIFASTVHAEETAANQLELNATAGMIFDEHTGQVVYSKNPDEKLAIGSITKIITLYLVTKAIKEGKFTEQDMLRPTQGEADMTQRNELTNVRLDADKTYSVKDLYNAAWIVSSNSAAMMLADKVAGNQGDFVKLMRKTIADWGIKGAQIYNVSGLNNSDLEPDMYLGTKEDENKLSANDIGVIVKHVLDEYPEIIQTTSKAKLSFPVENEVKNYESLNLLLKGNRDYQAGYEFDGLKTGTTDAAGESFVGTLPMSDTRMVTIVLNAQGEKEDRDKRFRSTQKLVHYLVDNYERKEVIKKNQTVTIDQKKYKTYEPVYTWLPKNYHVENLRYNVSSNDLGFTAIHKKQTVKLIAANTDGGYLPFKKADVKKVVHKKTNQKSWWDQIIEFFKHLF
ncbi:D-alanyl-D-alanine carboxypeptidase family protein [Companilactobacillus nantensis]|uniref:D-alanyl-D-alanine carboxypeptidase n=1 Tax=Companilactobacillus nantensis DSM 16982 TaxID=1423774 RepID=A0A0R1WA76_9LACO|nr:D-alanyl-D-alanine carboxypeptidase family protein [Companilactobacillus nantensis]KRM14511.1 D-alanyl-D-alanine carboxypeptidase precursor [Companilactobacillus nantensis DSM 16982]GEO65210.1 D-Ala-D-Ala carboxypeptidase [Companilactobacillus nantensis]